MYISCGGNGTAMEPETGGYIPNNPLFGLPLDSPQDCPSACSGCSSCQENSTLPISGGLHGSDFDCGNCLDHNGILSLSHGNSHSNISGGYWGEDMNSFSSLPPLDIEPLPSLFNFSPTCGPPYKTEKPTHDVADVLLSLKHAVLRPSPEPQPMQMQSQNFCSPHQASLSYSVHPQMLLSPTHQSNSQNLPYSNNFYESPCSQHVPIYPSMSVNVSMNMTMHGYDNNLPMQCSQMQWGPQNSSSVNVLYPPVLSPNSYPATYSFTADFRPPTTSTSNSLNGSESMKHSPPPHQQQQHQQPQQHHYQPLQQPNYSSMQKPYFQSNIGYPHSPQSKSPIYNNNLNNSNNNTNISSNNNSNIINNAHQNHQPHQLKVKDTKSLNSTFEDEDSSDDTNGKTNLCRLCGKTYARPSTLKTHLRTHSGERPYRCGDCNKSFSQAANLTAHVRTHTGQKPFRCPICDRRFSQSSSVTTHMRTHSGERPYRCRACKKAFSDSSTLTKHLRIHSGEKPYQCKLCLLRFSQSGNLNRHMRVHGANGALIT